jgi:hypothetical protein
MADYMVNLEAYKKACVNKAKPMMHCNGKCQMLKKMKKQEGDNGASLPVPKFNQSDLVLSSKTFFPSVYFFKVINRTIFFNYSSPLFSHYLSSFFRPPSDCYNL